jgi:signal transduction histidine kinase
VALIADARKTGRVEGLVKRINNYVRARKKMNLSSSWKKWTLQIAFGSAIILLVFIAALSYRAIARSNENALWVTHTRDVLKSVQLLRYSMEAVSSNIRGFLITGEESYLETYRTNRSSLEQESESVRNLTVDNPAQQRRIPVLDGLIAHRIQRAELLITLQRTAGFEAAADSIRSGPGKQITDDFEAIADQFQNEELRLLAIRNAEVENSVAQTVTTLVVGSILGLLITGVAGWSAYRDSSKRKRAEATLLLKMKELNRSNEELAQFASVASHDLQEPLRTVANYAQLLSRRYKGKLDADADEFIAFVVDGATRMNGLIQDLLTYSRVGAKEAHFHNVDSDEALQQAIINLRGAIEASGAQVTHDPLPAVVADKMQLTQLFQNLVGNAIKYQKPGVPKIHVSATKNGTKRWGFSVKDNGLGIAPQHFEKIFGMFQRLHNREEFAGTGIGLAICKKIVEQHGGSISVESQPGQGSIFHFTLAESEVHSARRAIA